MTRDPRLPWSTRSVNLAYFLTRNARRLGARAAVIRGTEVLSWSALDDRVNALAAALRDRFGLGPGDRVLVHAQNGPQMIEVMLACWRMGAVWVPANVRQSPDEVAYLAQKADVTLMICDASGAAHAAACTAAAPGMRHVIAIGGGFGADYEAAVADHTGARVSDADVDRDTPAWLFFTSGSTGRPKAVVLTHGQLSFVVLNHLHDLMPGTGPADISLVVAPLSHGAGLHQLVNMAAGAASVLMPPGPLDPAVAWELVARHRVTNMFTVPTIVKMLTEDPAVDTHDHSSLRFVIYAGAPMYREDQKHALRKLGPVLVQYFGLGEVTGAITVLPREDHHPEDTPAALIGTCGFERTGMQVSIQDAAGAALAPLQTGEICVAGPAVCAGYDGDDAANAAAFRDGWFRTGDLGHMDAEGYLYITGRASDMYISGGSNVYPREIEELLLTHPALGEVAVLGARIPAGARSGWRSASACPAPPSLPRR
ncbi:AMP-binding protein [Roseisalinus antarcticus]|uniref:Long-chain-fatty-acid--CoA ligase n=1 Tax=Roseisalinus antarcticus TaxID=254357 RepID=A0A1Y5RXP5_9RHOB|nr:AMP-binding protein [Roseisalinus antarcticus]SLN27759.1 Long-chain-fatty-acid--CoA ligase [Roseisalinus antarcticus]